MMVVQLIKKARRKSTAVARRLVHRNAIRLTYYVWRKPVVRPVFIICQPRTGSTYLQHLLHSIPGVSMTGEVLSPRRRIGIRRRFISKHAVLRHVRYSLNQLPDAVCGSKLLISQLRFRELTMTDLRACFPDARYLILHRESLLEQFISVRVAKATRQWIGNPGHPSRIDGKIHVDPDELRQHCQRQRESYADILLHDWLTERALSIRYEELAEDPQALFDGRIFRFLRLPPTNVTSPTSKQITRSMSDIVENYSELEPYLHEFRFQPAWPANASVPKCTSLTSPAHRATINRSLLHSQSDAGEAE